MKQIIPLIFFCLFILVRLSQANLPPSSSNSQKTPEKQRFAIEPVDSTARLGETIVLPCRVVNRVGLLQWTRDGFGLGLDRGLSGFKRYTMVGSEEEGDYSLAISNVQLEDDAIFNCQVGASANSPGIRSRSSKLTVFVPPEPVRIKEGEFLDTVEGKQVTLTCESNGGKPVVELSWSEENGNPINDGIEQSKHELADGKRFNSQAKWQFTAGKQHHNKRYTCRAENAALEEPQKASILIRVRFAPKVKLTYSGDFQSTTSEPSAVQEEDIAVEPSAKEGEELNENIVAHVGENVTINCDAVANPNVGLVYKWYKDEQIFPGDHSGATLNIPSIKAEYNGVKIGCEVLNSIGSSSVVYRQLSVSFAPKFSRALAKAYTLVEGSNLKLTCEVRSNPPAEIVWRFEDTIVGHGKHLQLSEMDYSKAGRYSCIVNVKGFEEIQSSTIVQIKGAPRMISSPNQYGFEGEQIKLECIVQSIPKATVVWRRNSQVIEVDNKVGYELITEPLPDSMFRHLLVIQKAKSIDFSRYNCTASNELGEDSILITLTKQKAFPTLMIIASVIGASTAFLCIGVVVLLVMRRSTKTGDDFSANLKKQTAAAGSTNSNMVLTNSSSNYNKALTDSARSHMTAVDGSSAANSDLKLEIRTSSSLSEQEHHNPVINWEDEMLMNQSTLLTANNMYNAQHVHAFDGTVNGGLNGLYDAQPYNQRFIITSNGVAPNYESIYNYPPTGLMANTLNMSQPINGVLNQNLINNNSIMNAVKYSPPSKQPPQQSPPTYHNLASLSSSLTNYMSSSNINHLQNASNLYLPSYTTDYGQLIDYMQVQPTHTSASQTTDSIDNASILLGYTITSSNGQPIITATSVPAGGKQQQCESAYSTLQTDSRYRAQCANYAARSGYSNTPISVNQPGLPSSPMYNSNQVSSTQPSAIQVPNSTLTTNSNSSSLRNYITNSTVNSTLGSVNSQATLATHV